MTPPAEDRQAAASPPAAAPAPVASPPAAVLSPTAVTVIPGSSAEFALRVEPTGDAIEARAVVVRGVPGSWVSCTPTSGSVAPGIPVTFRIAITPRVASTTVAGRMALAFEVVSPLDGRTIGRHDATLEVVGTQAPRSSASPARPPRRAAAVAVAVAVVAVLAVVGVLVVARVLDDAEELRTVPDLTVLDFEAASTALLAEKLEGLIIDARSDPQPFGRILLQAPAPGSRVPAKSTVNLIVSTGPEQWVLSDLRRRDYLSASAELSQRGMRIQPVSKPDNAVEPGTIVAQDPPAGTKLNVGDLVTLTVAKADTSAVVPKIPPGTSRDDAVRLIQQAGLQANVKPPVPNPEVPAGQVIEINPPGGQPTTRGSIVSVTVSKGLVVPSVVGQRRDAALQVLAQAGLTAQANERCSSEPAGAVVEQTPAANVSVDKGARVTLSVAKAC
ncbi:MAG: PASTA domain-containing protein [Acidimicrobiales bacterium]